MITSLAVRLATVRALRGRTLCGDKVHDTVIEALDQFRDADRSPFISVYTDKDFAEVDGRDLTQRARTLELTLELAVGDRVVLKDGQEEIVIPNTDAGLEASLDILERQVLGTLTAGVGVWQDLWRTLVTRIASYETQSGASTDSGVRFAARQITLIVDTLSDPPFGEIDKSGIWHDFLAALEADASAVSIADGIRSAIIGDEEGMTRTVAGLLGVNKGIADMLGLDEGVAMTEQEIDDFADRSSVEPMGDEDDG